MLGDTHSCLSKVLRATKIMRNNRQCVLCASVSILWKCKVKRAVTEIIAVEVAIFRVRTPHLHFSNCPGDFPGLRKES